MQPKRKSHSFTDNPDLYSVNSTLVKVLAELLKQEEILLTQNTHGTKIAKNIYNEDEETQKTKFLNFPIFELRNKKLNTFPKYIDTQKPVPAPK